MTIQTFPQNAVVTLKTTFTNLLGVGTNPTSVVLTLKDPAGTITTPTPTGQGSGVYSYDLALNLPGTWYYEWAGTGAVVAVASGLFAVALRKVTP